MSAEIGDRPKQGSLAFSEQVVLCTGHPLETEDTSACRSECLGPTLIDHLILVRQMKRGLKTALRLALLGSTGIAACAAMPAGQSTGAGARKPASDSAIAIGKASFRIPFTIDARGSRPSKVQLWVSTDQGASWQMHGAQTPDSTGFDFKAAGQGEYLFLVQSVDAAGVAYPSNAPPMRVLVDTEKPQLALEADITAAGQLAIDLEIVEPFLKKDSAQLRIRTNRSREWKEVQASQLAVVPGKPGVYRLKQLADIEPCREVAIVFRIEDTAGNAGEATMKYDMPRTASLPDLTLASTPAGVDGSQLTAGTTGKRFESIPGATSWAPARPSTRKIAAGENVATGPGKLAGSPAGLELELPGEPVTEQLRADQRDPHQREPKPTGSQGSPYGGPAVARPGAMGPIGSSVTRQTEELPLPPAVSSPHNPAFQQYTSRQTQPPAAQRDFRHNSLERDVAADRSVNPSEPVGPVVPKKPARDNADVFQCNTRTFSLDYSVESLGGSSLSDVQLWGTEDGGASWELWGTDPDRVSPFDVKVGSDGKFGFRMVIVGTNGVVSNRPKFGDRPDVSLEIDTSEPQAQITRAVYGKGNAEGRLVIDYQCSDPRLVQLPVSLYYRKSKAAQWQAIASGLQASDTYLWQPPRDLPDQIYLKVEAVDRAGNTGSYELTDAIDIKGLAPRGRIHRIRPIR